jgi:cell wall-associated NlpC family hydrolase
MAGKGRIALGAVVALGLVVVAVALASGGSGGAVSAVRAVAPATSSGDEVNLDPTAIAKARGKVKSGSTDSAGSHAQVVVAVPPGSGTADDSQPVSHSTSRAPSDAQIERDLSEFRKYLATIPPSTGQRAEVISTGEAAAPFNAPQTVINVVQAANQIALTPYKWGGGHGAWRDKGYDCSGSVSFALAAAGLLNQPLDSTRFETYGAPGKGRWITIYANATHAWMTVAGLRFDTGGLRTGTRWQASMRSTAGFVVRHPPGL